MGTGPIEAAPEDVHAPLRENVRFLGSLLGDTLHAQGGPLLLERVEQVRAEAKAGRSGDEEAARRLQARLEDLEIDEAVPIARAFAHFLTLANICEQHHRVRRRRDHARDPSGESQRASLDDSLHRLLAAGVAPDAITATMAHMQIELVLTAHPTETTRRTMLAKHQRIAEMLAVRDRRDLTPNERDDAESALRREIAAMWSTTELRRERPTPEDEARGGFAVIEHVLWDAMPRFLRTLDRALEKHTGDRLPTVGAPIRFGSWIGGDRDGNPNVTPEITRRVVWLARWMAADLFHRDIDRLRDSLSIETASAALLAATNDDAEPYRAYLRHIRDRLIATKEHAERMLDGQHTAKTSADAIADEQKTRGRHYDDTDELATDLDLLDDALRSTGQSIMADGDLLDTRRRVAVFGLDLVRLDLRQEASRHREAIAHLATHLGERDAFGTDPDGQLLWLRNLVDRMQTGELALDLGLMATDETHPEAVRDVFSTFAILATLPRTALGGYVISMASSPFDVLAVLALQNAAGIERLLPIIPLFETLDDLVHCPAVVESLLQEEACQAHVRDGLTVMIGYSDSAKDAGVMAAGWALYRAQERLTEIAERFDVPLTIFHGRGGSVGRGGGPAHAAVTSLPPGSVGGRLRVTEQGEVIQARYGLPGIALRTLELYVSGVLEATLTPPRKPEEGWRSLMDVMAKASRECYRGVLSSPGFVDYFHAATPEGELGSLKIGSRPARRRTDGGLSALRAIPWVFAWMQNRMILPGWLGVGEGLMAAEAAPDGGPDALRDMARSWPFFTSMLDLVEMGLAKSDVWVSRHYHDALVPPELKPIGDDLYARLDSTRDHLLSVLGHERQLQGNPVLRRSIDVRNPYVDPLNLLQVAFLQKSRTRDGPDGERPEGSDFATAIDEALQVTINGIAQGMRNTG